jgi:cobalt-zinc-cadmium efflux system membrane fusion protein
VAFDEDHTQRVASPLDGRATALLVKPGDKVTIGQALVELSSPQVAQLQADAQKAEQDLTLAQRTVERQRKLRADGATSEKELLQSEADLKKLTSDVGRATAQLRALGVSASDPTVGVALRARVAGTIVERNVLVGQEVRADASTPLLTITNLDVVWVLADVYEQDLGMVQEGVQVNVRVPAYPSEVFPGTVGHVGDVLDPQSRTVKVRCIVKNPDRRLKPEMFAKIELTESAGKKVLVVPSRAILSDADSSRIVVAGADNVYRLRVVQVGPEVGGKIRILDGVKAGERIVTDGALFLKNEIDNR